MRVKSIAHEHDRLNDKMMDWFSVLLKANVRYKLLDCVEI